MKNKRLTDSFHHAWEGLRHAVAKERNFRIHIIMGIMAVAFCIALRVETMLFIWVVFAIVGVLSMELFNTAVEALTDLYCGSKLHPLAKIAKDTAAAAVMLAAIQAVVVAAVIAVSVLRRYIA